MIRAVVDTNVLISGIFWGGLPAQIIAAAEQNRFTLLMSEALFNELDSVLHYSKFDKFLRIQQERPKTFCCVLISS